MAESNEQVATKENKSFGLVLTEKLNMVQEALPKDFNKARFVQNALSLLNSNTDYRKYSNEQLMSGLLKGAYLGLDFFSSECYLIPYGNNLNYQTGYRGDRKLVKKYSIRPIKDIYAKLVREGDEFEELIVNGEQKINFKPKPFNDGNIKGAFAVCLYQDGGLIYDTMSLTELENTRKQSKANNSPAWKNFTGEMYKKTVLHRLCKNIDLDFENPTQMSTFMSGMELGEKGDTIGDMEIGDEVVNPFEEKEEIIVDSEVSDIDEKAEGEQTEMKLEQ